MMFRARRPSDSPFCFSKVSEFSRNQEGELRQKAQFLTSFPFFLLGDFGKFSCFYHHFFSLSKNTFFYLFFHSSYNISSSFILKKAQGGKF